MRALAEFERASLQQRGKGVKEIGAKRGRVGRKKEEELASWGIGVPEQLKYNLFRC